MRPLDVIMRWRHMMENAQYLAELARMADCLYSEVRRVVETLEPLRIKRALIPWPGKPDCYIVIGRKLWKAERYYEFIATPEDVFSMIRSAGDAIAERVRPRIRDAFKQLVELVKRLREPRIKCLEIINDVVAAVGETLDRCVVMRPPVVLSLAIAPYKNGVFMGLKDRDGRAIEFWVENARLALSLCNHLDTVEELVREADALAKEIVLSNKEVLRRMWEAVASFAVEKALAGKL